MGLSQLRPVQRCLSGCVLLLMSVLTACWVSPRVTKSTGIPLIPLYSTGDDSFEPYDVSCCLYYQ